MHWRDSSYWGGPALVSRACEGGEAGDSPAPGPAVLRLSDQFPRIFELGQGRLFSPRALWDPRAPQGQTLSKAPLGFLEVRAWDGGGDLGPPTN